MTKIKNTGAYPIKKYPIPSDFFIGSDSENNGETINFEIQKIINMASGLKDYIFSMSSLPIVSPQGDGYFQTNGIKNFALITTLSISKKTLAGQDLTPFMTWLGSNLTEFTLYIVSKTNQNIFADFAITSVTEQTDYFVFTVTFAPGDNYLGELIEKDIYTFNYEKTAAGSVLDLLTQVITDGDTHHAPSGDAVYDALFLKAPLASPALTGVPTAPTAAPGTNTIQLANTSFVTAALTLLDATLLHKTGNEVKTGTLTVNSIIRAGGLATQFLKADGSIDSNTYLTAETDTLQSVTNRGAVTTTSLTALSFIKTGGLASQFLKANGSIDANVYALDSSVIHNTGNETKTGTLTVNSIIKAGGTAAQFLKADGSSDATVYAVDSTVIHTTGNEVKTGSLTVNSIIRAGGLATQFLKADGSIDSNTYLTTESDTLQSVTARGATTTLGITALSFIKSGGTASQYLMADGSVTTAANIIIPATQVTATPHVDYLTGANVQLQLDNTETNVVGLYKIDKTDDKTLKQTGRYRPDTDVSVLSISPADTLNITACDNILFVNEIMPDVPANKVPDFLKSFGNKSFVVNGTNTPLAADTRGIFYVGLDKLGNQVYRTSKIYDQDVAYMARLLVNNTAGVYTIVSAKYFPDLANNRVNNRDRLVLSSGYIVPSGAASISFGNRGMTYSKNSINYSNNKLDPNYLTIADSVNPTPMSFLFFLPNITSLAVSITPSTVLDPTVWYTAGGAVGGGAVNPIHYQVYKLFITVTGTIAIQTKASTTNAPDPGVNAIFATREAALAGLTSTIFPDVLPAGDSIALGTFYLRAGTAVNGSTMLDPNDFYFRPFTATSSSSSVGVTVHDLLSGKNDNPTFQHVTTTDIANWNVAYTNRITSLTTTGTSGAATLISNVLNIPVYAPQSGSANYIQNQNASAQSANFWITGNALSAQFIKNGAPAQNILLAGGTDIAYDVNAIDNTIVRRSGSGAIINGGYLATTLAVVDAVPFGDFASFMSGDAVIRKSSVATVKTVLGLDNGFILNQNASAQSANMWISGSGEFGNALYVTGVNDTPTSGIGVLRLTTAGTSLRFGGDTTYSWIQSYSVPLHINKVGNNTILNELGGNVGIGTASPAFKLDVNGDIRLIGLSRLYFDTNGENASNYIATTNDYFLTLFCGRGGTSRIDLATDNLIFSTASTEKVRIFANGNVGIGTNNPLSRTQINKAGQIINTTTPSGALLISDDVNTVRALELGVDTGNAISYMQARSLNSTATFNLALNPSGGNVGIGTTNPLFKTQIKASSNAIGLAIVQDNNNDYGYGFKTNSSTGYFNLNRIESGIDIGTYLTVDFFGNVGIGTTNPTAKLTIEGTSAGAAIDINNTTALLKYRIVTGNVGGGLQFENNAGSEVVRFTQSGNVLIGTTTDNGSRLRVSGGAGWFDSNIVVGATSSYGGTIQSLINQDGSTHWTIDNQNSGSSAHAALTLATYGATWNIETGSQARNNNDLDFVINPYSGAVTKMKLTSSGNLLIGTTTDNGYKLRVNGTTLLDGSGSGTTGLTVKGGDLGSGTTIFEVLNNSGSQVIRVDGTGKLFTSTIQASGAISSFGVFSGSHSSFAGATGNQYNDCALEIQGNGSANTIFPSIGFHQPGLYAATIAVQGGNFYFSELTGTVRTSIFFGNATATGTVTASGGFFNSDARLKDVISRDGDVVKFKWKDQRDSKQHIGVIAQEVQEVYPDMILEGEDGMLSVNYTELLLQKILLLEKRISELESKLK